MKKKISIITLSIIISFVCCFAVFKKDTKAETTSTYYTFTQGGATLVNVDMAIFNTGWKAIVINCQFYANYNGYINVNYIWNPSNPGWMNYNIITDNCVMTARENNHITLSISNSSQAQIVIAGSASNISKLQITTVSTSGFTYCSDITDLTEITERIDITTTNILNKLNTIESILSNMQTAENAQNQYVQTYLQWILDSDTKIHTSNDYHYTTGYSLSLDNSYNLLSNNAQIQANKDIYIKLYTPYNLFYFRGDCLYRIYLPYWSVDLNTGGTLETIDIIDISLFNESTKSIAMVDNELEYYIQYIPGGFILYLYNINIPQRSGYFPYLHIKAPNAIYVYGTREINVGIFDRENQDGINMLYQFSVLNGIERIIGAIGDISIEQTTNIDNTYNDLTIYNQQINTITNNYNDDINDMLDDIDMQDLIDIDPESENNVLNSVNYYNSVFTRIVDLPSIKSIIIFLLLCILIVALVG